MQPRIIRSRRSSLSLEITKEGEVVVKVPFLTPNFFIQRFLKEKEEWIIKTLAKVHKRKIPTKTYEDGEQFLFLGDSYQLTYASGIEIVLKDGKLLVPHAMKFRIKKELEKWYMRQASAIISKRVEFHAQKMNAQYTNIFYSDTRSKWGTCFADNTLQFNFRLVMVPLMVMDYVVIHELTHTTEKNHGDSFWRRVRLFTPAYKQHRKWLNEHAHVLQI